MFKIICSWNFDQKYFYHGTKKKDDFEIFFSDFFWKSRTFLKFENFEMLFFEIWNLKMFKSKIWKCWEFSRFFLIFDDFQDFRDFWWFSRFSIMFKIFRFSDVSSFFFCDEGMRSKAHCFFLWIYMMCSLYWFQRSTSFMEIQRKSFIHEGRNKIFFIIWGNMCGITDYLIITFD